MYICMYTCMYLCTIYKGKSLSYINISLPPLLDIKYKLKILHIKLHK